MAKAFYIGVNGVARKVKKPYIGVDNIARKVKKGYIGVNGVARQFLSGGTPISSLAVGSSIYLNENSSPIEYLVVHQGKPSSIYDDSCNGTWLLRKEIIESRIWASTNKNIYESSDIHYWLNSTMLSKYDANIQNTIKQVKIPYRANGGKNGSNQSGANGLSCKVFLLSFCEVGFTSSDYSAPPVDGAKLAYFESGSSTSANNKRIAYLRGTATTWYLRSMNITNTNWVLSAFKNGEIGHGPAYPAPNGIRPALIMPSNTLINTSTNTIII